MYQGKLISITGDRLVASDRAGRQRKNRLAPDAVVTCDGQTCSPADLKEGMRIRVTKAEERSLAIRVEALDKTETFEKPS